MTNRYIEQGNKIVFLKSDKYVICLFIGSLEAGDDEEKIFEYRIDHWETEYSNNNTAQFHHQV